MTNTRLSDRYAMACGAVLFALACLLAAPAARATENVEDSPYCEIEEPAEDLTFYPGDSVEFSGWVRGDCGDGPVIDVGEYLWTIVNARDESEVIFSLEGADAGAWTVPGNPDFEQYYIRLTAIDPSKDPGDYGSSLPRIATHQVRLFSLPVRGLTVEAGVIFVEKDAFTEEAHPNDTQDPGKVLVKNPPHSGNSRIGYWQFTFGTEPQTSAIYTIYSQNEITNNGGFDMSTMPGDFSEGSITWNNQPSDDAFTFVLTRSFPDYETYPAWMNVDITDFYNAHLGETLTLRFTDRNGRQIGPHFESRESVVYPTNRRARILLATPPDFTPVEETAEPGPDPAPDPAPDPLPEPVPDPVPDAAADASPDATTDPGTDPGPDPSPDAAADPVSDEAVEDAAGPGYSGGCGCRTATGSGGNSLAALFMVMLIVTTGLLRRRRRINRAD